MVSLALGPTSAHAKKNGMAILTNMSQVRYALEKKKQDAIEAELRKFVGCCRPNRFVGSKGHSESRQYLEKRVRELDAGLAEGKSTLAWESFTPDTAHAIALYQGDFDREIKGKFPPTAPDYIKWDRFTKGTISMIKSLSKVEGKNLVWEKKGLLSPDQIIVVGAHYDTISHDKTTMLAKPEDEMPGADDNGTGVAVGLGLIEFLSQYDVPKTVRVVFFDFEEVGFLGSRAYVQAHGDELKKAKFQGMVNLEMLGHDSKRSEKVKVTGDMRAYVRTPQETGHAQDMALAQALIGLGKKISTHVKFEVIQNGFDSSDHIHFWEAGLPAITFSQNWEDDFNHARYHTSNDFVETLNLTTYGQSWRFIIGAVTGLAYDLSP